MNWQDEQKKVATGVTGGREPAAEVTSETGADITMSWWHEPALPVGTKLYTQPKREWVGLTDEDLEGVNASHRVIAKWAEAKLKEKNA
jgi:hypothetical protein